MHHYHIHHNTRKSVAAIFDDADDDLPSDADVGNGNVQLEDLGKSMYVVFFKQRIPTS